MEIKLAVAIVNELGYVYCGNYEALVKCRELRAEWESRWLNSNKNYSFVDPPSIKEENTYDSCVQCIITAREVDCLNLEVILWDGALLDGRRTKLRCAFTTALKEVPEFLEHELEKALIKIGELKYAEEQEQIKARRTCELVAEFKADHQ